MGEHLSGEQRINPCCITQIPNVPTLDYAEYTCPLCKTKWVNRFDAKGWLTEQSDEKGTTK